MYLTGDFHEMQSAAAAILELKANRFSPEDLVVYSDEPVEFPRGVLDRPSRMSLASVLGAISFLLLAVSFVYFTQLNYPLVTGGMPLFSFWATGIIFYEMTMLGAIVVTFAWFLKESGVFSRRKRGPAPVVEPGWICLRVRCDANRVSEVTHWLNRAGAAGVKKLGEPE
jgi:ActD protein